MLKLYAAPRTRAVRVAWLLEEMNLPYQLELVEFQTTGSAFFIQATPTGKIPTLEDDDVVMFESGAIVEYLLERYDDQQLAPAPGTSQRARYLQWLHFSESTAFSPIGVVVWLTIYRHDAADHPELIADARARARTGLVFIENNLNDTYLAGSRFTAADIMMGFTLIAAQTLDLLVDLPKLTAYLKRLQQRDGLTRALQKLG